MSYANTAKRANPAAILGAFGVPAGFGVLLVTGLAIKHTFVDPIPDLAGYQVPIEAPPPPPPPETKPEQTDVVRDQPTAVTQPTMPDTDFTLSDANPIETFAEADDFVIGPVEVEPAGGTGTIAPMPALPDPISASPRNDPGRWVSDNDYRSNWIRKEWAGVAGFAVTIDAKGKVSDCTITRSTGHGAMDAATCKLIQRRAKFNPAKDSYGNPVAGSYSNSVNWRLPE